MSIFGSKKRKVDCASLNVGSDAIIGNNLTVGGNVTADSFSGGTITPTLTELPNGTAGAPPLTFTSDTKSGYFWDTTGTAGQAWSAGGTKKLKLDTNHLTSLNPVGIPDGSLGNPSLFFNSDSKSGLWFVPGTPAVALQVDGDTTITSTPEHNISSIPMYVPKGDESTPGIAFTHDIDTGLYCGALSSSVNTTVGGTTRMTVSETEVTTSVPISSGVNSISGGDIKSSGIIYPSDGNSASPSIAFDSDPTTGICKGSAGYVSFSSFGNQVMRTGATKIDMFQDLVMNGKNIVGNDITAFGTILAGFGTISAPGIAFKDYPSIGFHGSLSQTLNACIDNQIITQFTPYVTSFNTPVDAVANAITSTSTSSSWPLKSEIYWGDFSDGNVTLSGGNTTLTKDMYYNTLTLNSNHILNTQQYRIYARVITGDGTGIIRNNGANGGNGTAVAAGGQGVGILAASTGRTFASVNGGNGGGIGPGNGGSGGNCSTGLGANGARGGDSKSGQTGGAGGVQSTNIGFLQHSLLSFLSLPTGTGVYATGGGGGGGGGFLNSGGGGGGAPAGAVWIQAESIGGLSSIEAKGGNGGNSFDADSGCGGGGSGGFIFVLYKTLLGGFNLNASTSVAGGSNGTGNSTNSTTAQDGNKVLKQIT